MSNVTEEVVSIGNYIILKKKLITVYERGNLQFKNALIKKIQRLWIILSFHTDRFVTLFPFGFNFEN